MNSYSFDEHQVRLVLPHRKPMLMVDYVSHCHADLDGLTAMKVLSSAEPMVQEQPNGSDLFPPPMVIEALAQSCGFLMNLRWLEANGVDIKKFSDGDNDQFEQSQIPHTVLAESRAKHLRLARPGDLLRFESKILLQRKNMIQYRAIAKNNRNDEVFTELTVLLSVMEHKQN